MATLEEMKPDDLSFVVVAATSVGAFSPLIISRLGIDPTVVAAPLMATVIDLAGLTIYLSDG